MKQKNGWKALVILIGLFVLATVYSCNNKQTSDKKLFKANLDAFTKNAAEIEKYEAQQAGGEKKKKVKPVKLENTKVTFDSLTKKLHLTVTDSMGYVQGDPKFIGLPADWEKLRFLNIALTNPNKFDVDVLIKIIGARNVLPTPVKLTANQSKMVEISLIDLPLTARIPNIYSPNYIRIEVRNDQDNYKLIVDKIALVQTADSVRGAIVDAFGQRKTTDWPGKVKSEEFFKTAAEKELKELEKLSEMPERDKFGGWLKGQKFKATGFFRLEKVTENGTERWWFVTPEGTVFWSLGVTGVRPKHPRADVTPVTGERRHLYDTLPPNEGVYKQAYEKNGELFSFYSWNMIRKYSSVDKWSEMVYKRLPKWGLNSIGNWSEVEMLKTSPIPFTHSFKTNSIEEFTLDNHIADVFNPEWEKHIDTLMASATEFKDNPYLIGYFVDNEAGWGNPQLLEKTPKGYALRKEWSNKMQQKYKKIDALNKAWTTDFKDWNDVENMEKALENETFKKDMVEFETHFADTYFKLITKTLRKYDTNHLYLGCRFTKRVKPEHIVRTAGKYSDVITVNVYSLYPARERMQKWHDYSGRPILIGEHHLPLNTIRQLPPNYQTFTENERIKYYPEYIKAFAEMPFSLGCHWYQHADQQLTGRSMDGENQVVGIVDVTDQPHKHMVEAMRIAGKEIYKWHSASK